MRHPRTVPGPGQLSPGEVASLDGEPSAGLIRRMRWKIQVPICVIAALNASGIGDCAMAASKSIAVSCGAPASANLGETMQAVSATR